MKFFRIPALPKLWTKRLTKRKRPQPLLRYELFESRRVLAAEFDFVGDYQTAAHEPAPAKLTVVGNSIFFTATTSDAGTELWKTDGTVNNNTLVKDIWPASVGSYPTQLTNVGGTLYFLANDGTSGQELWKSDGTTSGTVLVADLTPGSAGSTIAKMTNFAGTLYFTASTSAGVELWKSNGTAAGTTLVKDISAGGFSSNPDFLTVIGSTLYFTANDGIAGTEIWKTDGTTAGTVLAIDQSPGSFGSSPRSLINVNGQLVFAFSNSSIAVSDGTQAGTTTINASGPPVSLTNVNGTLFFTVSASLWKSNLTQVGTTFLRTFNSTATNLVAVGSTLYFVADFEFGGNFNDLCKSDGTAAGTVVFVSGARPTSITNVNGTLYYQALWSQLWRSDGTISGSVLLKDDFRINNFPSITELVSINNSVFFATLSKTMWRSDGTAASTVIISDGIGLTGSSSFGESAEKNGELYFEHLGSLAHLDSRGQLNRIGFATSTPLNVNNEIYFINPNGLYKADGTNNPPQIKAFSQASSITNVNGVIYFAAENGTSGVELWKSNGTAAGTVLVKDIRSGSGSSLPKSLVNVNGTLYFVANDGISGSELWKSDGTAAGTVLVRDINVGITSSYPESLTAAGGRLFFTANDGSSGFELWRSDGTSASTALVRDINIGAASSAPNNLTLVGGTLYFYASSASGRELWTTLVATSFTSEVLDIQPGTGSSNPSNITEVSGTVYFTATNSSGTELWKTNGFGGGTSLVRDIFTGAASSSPQKLMNFNGTLYFAANDGTFGYQLWKSDGTATGTVPVTNPDGSRTPEIASGLWKTSNRLFFGGRTRLYGIELFVLSDTDFGDASNQTTFSQNGARHTAIGPQLGALRDTTEPNGLSSSSANGDDANGVDDEDLFAGPLQLERNKPVNLSIQVAGATTSTRLSGWFDWNLDGDWDDANEKVVSDLTVVNGSNTVTVTAPSGNAIGTGISRWRISEQTGLGPSGWAYTGEVEDHPFIISGSIQLTLPSTAANDVVIRKSGPLIQVIDRTNSNVLASEPLASLLGIEITGSDSQSDRVLVDYDVGGFFALPSGIALAGRGGNDTFSINGTRNTATTRTEAATAPNQSEYTVSEGSSSNAIKVDDFESFNLTRLASFIAQSKFTIGAQTYSIDSTNGVKLASLTTIAGGSLTSVNNLSLPALGTLSGSGLLSGEFISGFDSKVSLTGNMTIGLASSPAGFNYFGAVEIGPHTLTLLDSDRADFIGHVTIGLNGSTSTAPGKVTAANGISLFQGMSLTGAGMIETGSVPAKALVSDGIIVGTSAAAPLVLTGYVLGIGTLANVEVRGTLEPGVPTMVASYGAVVYQGTLALDLLGNTPGTGYDQISHTGNATLGGTLSVSLGNNFTPTPGTQWTLLRTTGSFTGQFSNVQLPAPVFGRSWQVITTSNSVILQLVDLVLTINPTNISEIGGSVSGTVTRSNLDLTQALVVSLTSSDTTEATVPASVTIPAGATSANFSIQIIDDTLLDDFQIVTITATATGYGSDIESLTVTDFEALLLTASVTSVSENAGSITGTVTRNNTDNGQPRTINLSSSDLTEISVPATVTIPAGQSSVNFTITIVDDNLLDGTQTVTLTAQSLGYVSGTRLIDVLDHELLTLTLLSTTISEQGGSTQARVARNNTNISSALAVNIASSDSSEATVPTQVIIPAGFASALFSITAVDDSLLDGTQNVSITVSSTGYQHESQSLSVTDFETLSLSLSLSSINENGGTSTATITRNNTDIAQPLTVTLSSTDTSEATVPTTVTLAANQSSTTFAITSVDDSLLDGPQSVVVSASAAGYQAASSTLTVVDSEPLLLSLDRSTISEKGGSATGTVRRGNTDIGSAIAVQITSTDTTEASVPTVVIIPAGSASTTFTISAVDDALLDGTQSLTIGASAAGYVPATVPLSVTDYETLSITLTLPAISENSGTTIGTVTRSNTDIAAPLVVQLQSGDTTEALVPSSVTIPAGQASTTFTVTAVDDLLQDGTQTVTILAQASGYVDGTQTLDVVDSVALSLSINPLTISENGGTAVGTVTRSNSNVESTLLINLTSSDVTEATVPATVQIAAGQSSATFTITAVDDSLLDGSQTVTLGVAATGYSSATRSITVLDFEQLQLSIDAASISESGGTTRGRVTRLNTDIGSSITINLASSDMSEAIVPASVIIPANQTTVAFDITAIDDALLDDLQTVTITAAGPGYQSATATLTVSDSEDLAIQVSANSMSERSGQVTGTVRRSNTDVSQALTVNLTSSDVTEATVPATVVIPAGAQSAQFLISAVDDNLLDGSQTVTIRAAAGGYANGTSDITVLDHETLNIVLANPTMSEFGGKISATVTRSNTDNALPLVVQLTSSDTSEATVPTTVTIPANASGIGFEVSAIDDLLLDGSQLLVVDANASNYFGAVSSQITVSDYETLTLSVSSGTLSEEGGSIIARVQRSNTDTQLPLTVLLSSSDVSEGTVPNTIVIPAGQSSTEFTIQAVDDNLLDGNQTVIVTASEPDYVAGSVSVVVTDLERLQLQLSKTTISEAGGQLEATITRNNTDLNLPLTVNLQSSDPSEVSTPATVTILAGQASATVTILSVDDQLLDGPQAVVLSASADAYRTATAALTVTDAEKLTIAISSTTISEAGGNTTAVVTRSNTDQSLPLTVQLTSSDTSEATVPATVTIAANQASVTFEIRAVDDSLLDGSQSVTIDAQATGYEPGMSTVLVTDAESLFVTLSRSTMSERADSIIATITRSNTNQAQPLDVTLAISDTSEASAPTLATIPANASSVQVTLNSVDDDFLDGSQSVMIAASAPNYTGQSAQFEVLDFEQLFLAVDRAAIRESDGQAMATVTRSNSDVNQSLVVQLASSDPSELSVPSQVTIPAGQASVQFLVQAVDDNLLDGNQSVMLTSQAGGYANGLAQMSITDSETVRLQLSANLMSEQGGLVTATVTRSNSDLDQPLVVQIVNSDPSELAVPAQVTIPAGQASVQFTVQAVDDDLLDGSQSVTLTAQAGGYESGSVQMSVTDSETIRLQLSALQTSEQGGQVTATVTRGNSDIDQPLVVQIVNSDPSELSVPAQVTILAGQASVQFVAQAVDDNLLDGSQSVTLTVQASGYESGSGQMTVTDSEAIRLQLSALQMSEQGGQVTATVTRGNNDIDQPLVVQIVNSDPSELSVPAQVTILAGQASIQFTVQAVDDDLLDGSQSVTLTVQAGGYESGDSVQLTVTDSEAVRLQLSALQMSEQGGQVTATVTRSNNDIAQPLVVQIANSDPSELSVPAQVTILAGQASVQFAVQAVDDDLLDGSQSVTLTVQASGYEGGSVQMTVTDSEAIRLQLSALQMSEQGGQVTATVTRGNNDIDQPLVVQIVNSDPSELSVPAQATILAGQTSVQFAVQAVDDSLLDGSQLVTLTVQAGGYQDGLAQMSVSDSEALTLQLSVNKISERGGQATATVTRGNSDNLSALEIALSSSDPNKASVPGTLTIPAGSASAQFTIVGVDNTLLDGLKSVSIVASAAGYLSATGFVDIEDDERLFPWHNPRDPLDVNDSSQVTALDALLVINAINTRFVLTPTLPDPFDPVAYVDVNSDGALAPIDALLVINYLNSRP